VKRIFGAEIEVHKYAKSARLRLGNHPAIQARNLTAESPRREPEAGS
jgi:hypothetical protein